MNDEACISFLQWALPRLNLRWHGFKKVRGQVCKRLARRLDELGLPDLDSYHIYLEGHPLEWRNLDAMCRITISRFYRDRGVYNSLGTHVLPELLSLVRQENDKILSCWCIGAASGEEPYSLCLLWEFGGLEKHGIDLDILATEVDLQMIFRARKGCYPASSIRELPAEMTGRVFTRNETQFCLKDRFKKRIRFLQQDIRKEHPNGTFHLILCRNLVFTYFHQALQEEIAQVIRRHMKRGGFLVLGSHERLPEALSGISPWLHGLGIYRQTG